MIAHVGSAVIELIQGDITESDTDAIVNAANSSLVLGAGVAGAIRAKGGPEIQKECAAIGHCPVGGAVITSGGRLKARFVIHAVGPRMGEGGEEEKLRRVTINSLRRAHERHLASIAFPAISTGVFGYPLGDCARIMLTSVRDYLAANPAVLKKVRFVLFDGKSFAAFADVLRSWEHA